MIRLLILLFLFPLTLVPAVRFRITADRKALVYQGGRRGRLAAGRVLLRWKQLSLAAERGFFPVSGGAARLEQVHAVSAAGWTASAVSAELSSGSLTMRSGVVQVSGRAVAARFDRMVIPATGDVQLYRVSCYDYNGERSFHRARLLSDGNQLRLQSDGTGSGSTADKPARSVYPQKCHVQQDRSAASSAARRGGGG